jgi:hypothetical protein
MAHPQPVIPYAEAATSGSALDRHETDDGGVEIVIAPPPLWRLLLGTTSLLLLLTVLALATVYFGLAACFVLPMAVVGSILPIVTAVETGAWVMTMHRLWREGRYGRLASVLRASPAGVHVVAPSLPHETHRQWARAAISDVLVHTRKPFPWVLPVIRVQVWFRGGTASEVRIPWRGGEPLEPVERRIREVLGLPTRQPE